MRRNVDVQIGVSEASSLNRAQEGGKTINIYGHVSATRCVLITVLIEDCLPSTGCRQKSNLKAPLITRLMYPDLLRVDATCGLRSENTSTYDELKIEPVH